MGVARQDASSILDVGKGVVVVDDWWNKWSKVANVNEKNVRDENSVVVME